jgi:hypothetical protein
MIGRRWLDLDDDAKGSDRVGGGIDDTVVTDNGELGPPFASADLVVTKVVRVLAVGAGAEGRDKGPIVQVR